MNAYTVTTLVIALIGCLIACGGIVWRSASAIAAVSAQANLNRAEIEHLHDKLESIANGLKERIDHAKTRLQAETEKLDSRVDAIQLHLNRHSNFDK